MKVFLTKVGALYIRHGNLFCNFWKLALTIQLNKCWCFMERPYLKNCVSDAFWKIIIMWYFVGQCMFENIRVGSALISYLLISH
jgi:hypothetical protein